MTPALLLMLATQLPFDTPKNWKRAEDPNSGAVALAPAHPGLGRQVVVMVFKPQLFTGSAADYHAEIVRRTMLNARQLEPRRDAAMGPFLITSLHEMVPQGNVYLRIYTARYGDVGQTFLFSANTLDATAKFLPPTDSMIARITVPAIAAVSAAPAPPPTSSSAPPPATRPGQLDGVYLTLKAKGGYGFGVSKDFMAFFPDGQVFWHMPEEGFLDFDFARSQQQWHEFWGHYEMHGSSIHVTFKTGPSYDGRRNADGSLLLGGNSYLRQTSGSDGRTLSGTYRAYNLGQDPSDDVTFYPDGRFEDKGIRVAVGALDLSYGRAKVPTGPGRGRYRIARYSIVFAYTDGRREQLSFYVPDDDGTTTPKQLVINTFNVVRVTQ